MGTISRAGGAGVTDPALKRRLMAGRNTHNWAQRQRCWARRREVYGLWWRWREKFGPYRGIQALIASHLQISRATISRDFKWLDLRGRKET